MRVILSLLVVVFWTESLLATAKSASFLCRKHISYTEKKMGIPTGLLAAISIIESGKKAKGHADLVAWPWVINVEGKPEYYKNKTDAVKALSKYLDQGTVNIDVGCMQINFRHHGAEFRSPSYMMDPRRNVAYAAKFLGALRKQYGSWTKAVGHYHSATLKHQVPYRHKVYRKWQKVRHQQNQQQGQEKQQMTLVDMGMKMASQMSVQARRLMGPLEKDAQKKKRGYDLIKPQKPVVTLRKIKPKKGLGGLVHPNDRPPNQPTFQASYESPSASKRTPHFFSSQK